MPRKRLIIGQRLRHIPAGSINANMDDIERLQGQLGHPPGTVHATPGGDTPVLVIHPGKV